MKLEVLNFGSRKEEEDCDFQTLGEEKVHENLGEEDEAHENGGRRMEEGLDGRMFHLKVADPDEENLH